MSTPGVQHPDREVLVRPATEDDGPRLTKLELETPIVVGGDTIVYDRSPDYFAFARVMEMSDTVLAECAGEVVGVHSASFHRGVLNDEEILLNYIHHLRVRPGEQGRHIFPKLKGVAVRRYPKGRSGSYAYVDVLNSAVLSRMGDGFDKWDAIPVLLEIDLESFVDSGDGDATARTATAADARAVAALLEATHGHKELWSHPTAADLAVKFARSPRDYAWSDVWIADGAAVGMWRAGRTVEVRRSGPGGTTARRPVVLADHGFARGAEGRFLAVLRTAAAACRADGLTSLAVFTTDRSATTEILWSFADSMRTFVFVAARLKQPAHGKDLYVDPIYF